MKKSTIVIFNQLNIKNNKNDKDNLKKNNCRFSQKKKKKKKKKEKKKPCQCFQLPNTTQKL